MDAPDVPPTSAKLIDSLRDEADRFDGQASGLEATGREDARHAAQALRRASERLRAAAEWIELAERSD